MDDDDKIENPDEEVARETTLQDMVEQLSESNLLQKSLQEQSLKTTDVLTNIATILQSQLDLSERAKLDEGRQLPQSEEDDNKPSPFKKLEMPTSIADTGGLLFGVLGGLVGGFFSELRFLIIKTNVDITKATKKLKSIGSQTKVGRMFKGITDSIKLFFSRVGFLLSQLKAMFLDKIRIKEIKAGINSLGKTITFAFGPLTSLLREIGAAFTNFGTKVRFIFSVGLSLIQQGGTFVADKIKKTMDLLRAGISALRTGIVSVFNFFLDPIRDALKMIPKPNTGGGAVSKVIDGLRKFFKMFQAFFSGFGRLLARIAFPITLVMGLFEAISTAIDDFKNQEGGFISKFIAGAFGFIKGAIGFIITDFLDLIKSAVSWIIEKIFGDDNPVTAFLDSFSITELFEKGIDMIRDFFLGIPKYFENALKEGGGVFGALGVFVDDIIDTVSNIIGFIGEMLSKIGDYVLNKIPEPFLKLLGISTSSEDTNVEQVAASSASSKTGEFKQNAEKPEDSADAKGGRKSELDQPREGSDFTQREWDRLTDDENPTRARTAMQRLDPQEMRKFKAELAAWKGKEKKKEDEEEDGGFFSNLFGGGGEESPLPASGSTESDVNRRGLKDDSPLRPGSRFTENQWKSFTEGNIQSKQAAIGRLSFKDQQALTEEQFAFENAAREEAQTPPIEKTEKTGGGLFDAFFGRKSKADNDTKSIPIAVGATPAAVNQGEALESGTNQLAEGKSKQQTKAPLVISNPDNSQKTTNNVSNSTVDNGSPSAADAYDPYSSYSPWKAAR